jgi:peptidyl-dipeptidase Dcp
MNPNLIYALIGIAVTWVLVFVVAIWLVRRNTAADQRHRKINSFLKFWVICGVLALAAPIITSYIKSKKTVDMNNPFFTEWTTPFGVPPFEDMRPEHFKPAFEEGMRRQRAEIDSIVANPDAPTFDNVILAYDRSGELYGSVGRVFGALTSAETDDELEKIKAEMSPMQSAHNDAIALDEGLFAKIRAVYDARHSAGLDAAGLRLTERVYQRFVRNGALLSADDKETLRKINEELSLLSVRFEANNRGAVNSYRLVIDNRDASGLPSAVIARAKARAREEKLGDDRLVFNLSKPSWIPFLTYSDREDLRRQLYQAWLDQCAEGSKYGNAQIINDIIRLRTRRAHLLGFESFAAFQLDDKMAKTPDRVYEFLDGIWAPALEKATAERDEMLEIKRRESGNPAATLNSWDWWFYAEKIRRDRFSFEEEQARPYFSLDNVRSGIFKLCNRLYGISFRPIVAPVYHKDVTVYEVLDIDNSHLGVIYMDFFPRPGKGSGAWCGSYRSQGYTPDGVRISPITNIVCNFTEPSADTPSLLSLDETETFFHEFGHALHNLFADVPYRGLLGVERDFVELPSQIMENWAFQPAMLSEYAIQYRTGDAIPARMVERIGQSAMFNQGFVTTELVAASLSDMDIHMMKEYTPFNVADFERYALATKRGLIPEIEPRYRYPYFSHIFDGGYSAGYYSYIWAEVLDKDAYEAFVESGDIFSRTVANNFRHKVLAPRGLRDGMDLYRDFRGAEPGREALLRGRGLLPESELSADSLQARRLREEMLRPQTSPPDSVLRQILQEGPVAQ